MRNYFTTEALQEPSFRNFLFVPLMGLAFLMFLPFIGFYLVFQALAAKLFSFRDALPGMMVAPGTAHLTGHEPSGKLIDVGEALSDIENEIRQLRK